MKKPLLPLALPVRRACLAAGCLLALTLGLPSASNLHAAPAAAAVGTNDASSLPVFYPLAEQRLVRVGGSLTYQVAADNGPLTYAATDLPPGTTIDPDSGLISGVTTQDGTFNATVSATNAAGTSSVTVTLVIDPPLPVVTLTADVPNGYPAQGIAGSFLLTRSGGDLTQPLPVTFIVRGSAKNGQDYTQIATTKKIKANKTTRRIFIYAADESGRGVSKNTVKLLLQTADTYTISGSPNAKVKIFYTP